jgi:formate dehydrogenase subunit delta
MSHDLSAEQIRANNDAKLIRMGNQIATFFSSQNIETGGQEVAEHINKFWEPRMRRQFFVLVDSSSDKFHDLLKAAIPHINKPEEAAQN